MDLTDNLKSAVDAYWEAANDEKLVKDRKDTYRQELIEGLPELLDLPGSKELEGFKHKLKVRRDGRLKLDVEACKKSEALNTAIDKGRLPEVTRFFKLQMSRETFDKVCEVLKQNGLIDAVTNVQLDYELSEKPDEIRKRTFDMQHRLGVENPLSAFLEDAQIPRFYLA